jgi:hypothetical protein
MQLLGDPRQLAPYRTSVTKATKKKAKSKHTPKMNKESEEENQPGNKKALPQVSLHAPEVLLTSLE